MADKRKNSFLLLSDAWNFCAFYIALTARVIL